LDRELLSALPLRVTAYQRAPLLLMLLARIQVLIDD